MRFKRRTTIHICLEISRPMVIIFFFLFFLLKYLARIWIRLKPLEIYIISNKEWNWQRGCNMLLVDSIIVISVYLSVAHRKLMERKFIVFWYRNLSSNINIRMFKSTRQMLSVNENSTIQILLSHINYKTFY